MIYVWPNGIAWNWAAPGLSAGITRTYGSAELALRDAWAQLPGAPALIYTKPLRVPRA